MALESANIVIRHHVNTQDATFLEQSDLNVHVVCIAAGSCINSVKSYSAPEGPELWPLSRHKMPYYTMATPNKPHFLGSFGQT